MKLEFDQPDDVKRKWKIVRRDLFTDVPGYILSADEETGKCQTYGDGDPGTKSFDFGPRGMTIVPR